jgi:glyoxylase I family protein
MPRFAGVDHFGLSVTDLDASHHFYTEILGFVPVFDFGYARIYLHNPSGFSIALLQHREGRRARFSELTTGLDHLGFTASSLEELREWEQRFREAGVEFTPIREAEFGHHLNFRDPDGIALEFTVSNDTMAEAFELLRSGELSDEQVAEYAQRLAEELTRPIQ